MLNNPLAVRSGVPRIYGGQIFSFLEMSMVSVREMGGFPVVLPPRVALSAMSGPPLPKPPMHKSGAIKQDTTFPCVTSAPRLPMTSPPRLRRCSTTISATSSLSCPRPATVSSPRHLPVRCHITLPYTGPASVIMLTSSRKSAKSAKCHFLYKKRANDRFCSFLLVHL